MTAMTAIFAQLIDVISFMNVVMKLYQNAVNLLKIVTTSKFVPLILVTRIDVSMNQDLIFVVMHQIVTMAILVPLMSVMVVNARILVLKAVVRLNPTVMMVILALSTNVSKESVRTSQRRGAVLARMTADPITNASISDVTSFLTNANIDLKSAMIRINVRKIHAAKKTASVRSNQLRGVIADLREILVRPRSNVVAISAKRRNASNSCILEIYVLKN